MPDDSDTMRVRRNKAGYYEEDTTDGPETCETNEEQCATDDEPDSEAPHPPGTPDDLPYSLGEDAPNPDDLQIGGLAQGSAEENREQRATEDAEEAAEGSETAVPEEGSDLWREQQGLISIDEKSGYNVEEFSEEERADIEGALGDDAAEPLPEASEGTSATGSTGGEEHGGFPER